MTVENFEKKKCGRVRGKGAPVQPRDRHVESAASPFANVHVASTDSFVMCLFLLRLSLGEPNPSTAANRCVCHVDFQRRRIRTTSVIQVISWKANIPLSISISTAAQKRSSTSPDGFKGSRESTPSFSYKFTIFFN